MNNGSCVLFQSNRLEFKSCKALFHTDAHKFIAQLSQILTKNVIKELPSDWERALHPDEIRSWLIKLLAICDMLAMLDKANGDLIGLFIVYKDGRSAHIGYLLGEQYWRQGLAKEALKALIHYFIEHDHLDKLYAGVESANLPSINLLEHVGFIKGQAVSDYTTSVMYEFDCKKAGYPR